MAEEQKFKVSAPLYIDMGVKKVRRYHLNLNQYRNWHYQINNKLKATYKALVEPQIRSLSFNKIDLTFTLYKRDRRKVDRANVLSVHEKFFCDALVESGCLPDDNDDYVQSTHYYSGGIDKNNPRVEIEIKEVS